MRRLFRCWTLLLVLQLPGLTEAAETMLNATYKAEYLGIGLSVVRTLRRQDDGHFLFESVAQNGLARIEEASLFSQDSQGRWVPQRYRYQQSLFGIRKGHELHFDTANGHATYISGSDRRRIPVEAGTLDPLLYQLKLQRDLSRQQQEYSYQFIRRSKLKHYRFKVAGTEKLRLNGREIEALKLIKQDDHDDQATRIWFSTGNGHQLVRLSHTDEGENYVIELDQLDVTPEFESWLIKE